MKKSQAPYRYIEEYYERRLDRRERFVEARLFYELELNRVTGTRIINIGCGPQFYDDLRHFGSTPKEYIGVDLNAQNFEFMNHSDNNALLEAKHMANLRGVDTKFVHGSIFDFCNGSPVISNVDCVVSIGFLGIFSGCKFKEAVSCIKHWLCFGGKLVNLSWCGNFQEEKLLQKRLEYNFNNKDNTGHNGIIKYTQEVGLHLVSKNLFIVPNKCEYGWSSISACVFEKK